MKFKGKRIFGEKMNLDDVYKKYPVLKRVVERIKDFDKIDSLFPPQADAIKSGYLEGKNLVLAIPTCSGKTLCAELAMLKTILEKKKKAIYLVPLKALAMEKYREFKEKYEPLGIKIAISIGDYDQSDSWLSNFDIIVTSNEKCDSLLRHEPIWFNDIGIVVADEIHLLDDISRGPTLEIVLARLMDITSAQIVALSATIKNSSEIADWLDANLVESSFRPVKLYEGVFYENMVNFPGHSEMDFRIEGDSDSSVLISKYMFDKGKQSIVFVSTRKSAELEAEKIAKSLKNSLKGGELEKLTELANKIEHALEHPTRQCNRLAEVVRKGVAFHHAGLHHKQKDLIEDSFRSGLIKTIAATTTLAYGVNLPSDVCIIRDVKRYYPVKGYDFIPVLEYKQCAGRAGRIRYSSEGRAIILTKNKKESQMIAEHFILGETEEITSKLGVEPVLRVHSLALIASGVTPTKNDLNEFFSRTFYAHHYKDMSLLNKKLENAIEMLKDFGFVRGEKMQGKENPFRKASDISKGGEKLEATLIGKRVSELYLDPLTANYMIKNLTKAGDSLHPFALLHLISRTLEMRPALSLRKVDIEKVNELMAENEKLLLEKPPNMWDVEYEDYTRSIKSAWFFSEWMNEMGEDRIFETFSVAPGELHVRLSNADWLIYSAQELALLLGLKELLKDIRKTRIRVKYGVGEELLPLVRLKGIGRVRARMLFSANLRGLSDLRKVPLESLSRVIGPKVAKDVKEQLNEMKEEQTTIGTGKEEQASHFQ
jgi:helicase